MSDDQQDGNQVTMRVLLDRRINLALQQNDVPPVKEVEIVNHSSNVLTNLVLRVTSEPPVAQPYEARIATIPEGAAYKLNAVDLCLSTHFLWNLTERIRCELKFELLQEGATICSQVEQVMLLARDEWSGFSSLPEIISAFVTPNHPVVAQVLRQAADYLGEWTGSPSLSGYQSKDRNRVVTTSAAVYAAVQQANITYINPPASFEDEGQRIRLPDRIWAERMGTCLDLAVFMAGCLEQAGLHPILVFVKGHAFLGVWLEEECFTESVVHEPLDLRKRVDLREIAVFDPTGITNRPATDFDQAVNAGLMRLANIDEFLCAVDIRRCRMAHIRPVPETIDDATANARGANEAGGQAGAPKPPTTESLIAPVSSTSNSPTETPATRLDRWQRKLLDLSLRNRLINFRESRKTVPILCPDISGMEDALADGTSFRVLPRAREYSGEDPRDPEAFSRRTAEDPVRAFLRSEMKAKKLHSSLTQAELDRNLIEVYRQARLGIEEGGASALYLALGFLAWYETPESSARRLAPILLLPLELNRKSSQEGFSLKLSDDEPRLNVTLIELIKKDHGVQIAGLEPLPEDESGVDVQKVLRVFREAVRDIPRWDVIETAHIGVFSFAKFLMWRDLALRAADLTKNQMVDHLVNRPDQPFDPGGKFPDEERLDDDHSAVETYCPLPADGSQLAAVFAAAGGKSFVLQGPPGTGKSQTITNLIAHCMANGRTVLFVSEKMAALSVVQRRLAQVGLGRHCLEVHSNKANKQEVLDSLNAVLSYAESRTPEDWHREARRLDGLRSELNGYARALHQKRSTGETVFMAISCLIGLRDVPRIDLGWDSRGDTDCEVLDRQKEEVDRLANVCLTIGDIHGNPWDGAQATEWTPDWEERVSRGIAGLLETTASAASRAADVTQRLSLREADWSAGQLALIRDLSVHLINAPDAGAGLLVQAEWEDTKRQLGDWVAHGRHRDALRNELYPRFLEKILDLDIEGLTDRLDGAMRSRWPLSWWRQRGVAKSLAAVSRDRKSPGKTDLPKILADARSLREETQRIKGAEEDAVRQLGTLWNGGEPDWKVVEAAREWADNVRALASTVAGEDAGEAVRLRSQWAIQAGEKRKDLGPEGPLGRVLRNYEVAFRSFEEGARQLGELLQSDPELVFGAGSGPGYLARVRSKLESWAANRSRLRDWCAWRRAREAAIQHDLKALVIALEEGRCQGGMLPRVFRRAYYEWWYRQVVSNEPVLARFFSPEHTRKIEQFRECDDQCARLARDVISARLAERVPATSAIDIQNSEVGILKREATKKRRHMPIRKLFQSIPNLLPRLKPCLLMSPMSIAQYLDAAFPPFDLVVFDEASQIPVWDAVGAIARGKQVIVVGDPKQLPPTSFFQRLEDAEEEELEEGALEDLESILDDCIAARVPELQLNWHYRSRHESLIAFSNHHYYGNRLLTFPAPIKDDIGVSLTAVPNGVYDRGRSATNREEANAVVEEIVRRVSDPELIKWSIGVVTFSIKQQTLIEDLLEEVRRTNPTIDAAFSEDSREPIFIKNLENVQGDERDVILFSICYGPDSTGRVAMNFGPMNRDGGERRLNVAITRARREVIVFSTLRADQIDLARTKARGVQDLKDFLEYAERGPAALASLARWNAEADFESPFEEAVAQALTSRGWDVHRQVGCAKYRIDLAVVDPVAKGRYLLGIECDGANYHRAKVARDRDKLREGVLRDLGWRLHRVWSTDWWSNPDDEISKIEKALASAREDLNRPRHVPQATSAAPSAGQFASAPPFPGGNAAAGTAPRTDRPQPSAGTQAPRAKLPTYKPHQGRWDIPAGAEFYDPSWDSRIREVAIAVVDHEAPITLSLATRRIAACWGLDRIHEKALNRVRTLIARTGIVVDRSDADGILWPRGAVPEDYQDFRVPGTGPGSARDADDLPVVELANAAYYILKQVISAPESEIIRETARLFGFRRTGRLVDERMRKGLDLLVKRGAVSREGHALTVRKE